MHYQARDQFMISHVISERSAMGSVNVISQEAGQVVWYCHLLQNYPQCIVIHTVKGFGIVNKAEIDGFLELSCFFHDPEMLAI